MEQDEFTFSNRKKSQPQPAEGPSPPSPIRDVPFPPAQNGPLQRLMDNNFLQYASYVIRDRAIPELEDGLKPVQRRILHSLFENDDKKFIKVANIVGHCMQYHPHGDASITEALIVLTNKRFLIEGQGNFGNLHTGDPAAASRYIECRLTDLARDHLFNPNLTEYVSSYDGRKKEPVTLPAKLPLLLMLGAEGIAVGISTKILPHNFKELLEAQVHYLKKRPFSLYPDFVQGGIMDVSEYNDGKGKVRVRARIEQKDEQTLVIREIPVGTTTETVIRSIEEAARKKRLSVKSIKDFTAEKVEIEIKLQPGQIPEACKEALYAFSLCEVSLNSRIVVIHNNRPVELTVTEVVQKQSDRLVALIEKELLYKKGQLLEELYQKSLIQLFIEHRMYKRIEKCKTYALVRQAVRDGFQVLKEPLGRELTNDDIEMLLRIPIKRISQFDIEKNRKDRKEIEAAIAKTEKELGSLVQTCIRYLKGLLNAISTTFFRRTRVERFKRIEVKKLVAEDHVVNYNKETGYLGHGVQGQTLCSCTSHDRLLVVWSDGLYKLLVPSEKQFVDQHVIYGTIADKEKVYTVVYEAERITYFKSFRFGGGILNKAYHCIPSNGKILYFIDQKPPALYAKYRPAKNQKVHQQLFSLEDFPIKGVKARGNQLTAKRIKSISHLKPRTW